MAMFEPRSSNEGERGTGPVYLQIGYPKSGNFWLYKILKNIQLEAGIGRQCFIENQPISSIAEQWELSHSEQASIDVLDVEPEGCFYRISSVFKMPIDDITSYFDKTSHVWTHSKYIERSDTVLSAADRIVYIIRDPRDVVVSLSNFVFSDYMQKFYPSDFTNPEQYLEERFEEELAKWAEHIAGYLVALRQHDIHIVFFERLLNDFEDEFGDLLDYLGIDLNQKTQQAIRDRVSFSTMKANNPRHVRKGTWGRWTEKLTSAQARVARRRLEPLLTLLNYPLDRHGGTGDPLPRRPGPIKEQTAKEFIGRARPLKWRLADLGREIWEWKQSVFG